MRRILLSFFIIGLVATIAVYATNAYFSDTEISTGNTFTAGAIDLLIDNDSWYFGPDGLVHREDLSWDLDDLTSQLFFNYQDLKPGDWGEDTVSIHVNDNDAYVCTYIGVTQNDDMSSTEPELADGDIEEDPQDDMDGELAQALQFVFWLDDSDNVYEDGEQILMQGPASDLIGGRVYDLSEVYGGPLEGGATYHIGKYWCYGDLEPTSVLQGESSGPNVRGSGFTCSGLSLDNTTQTDNMMGDVAFYAEQARHNENFSCDSWNPHEVYDYINIGDATSETSHNLTGWSDAWVKPGWGGNYGGGSSDESLRLLMGQSDGCGSGYEDATFTMNAGSGWATKLTLEHLDGSVDDSFDVFINNVFEGNYTAGVGGENWVTTVFPFGTSVTGTTTVKLVSTQPDNEWCATWGQVAFSNALLE